MIGETISHYKILEKLGEGGMGVVYKAEDTKLKRTVALKFLSPQALGAGDERVRFVREAQAAASLNHPNICQVYEIDEFEGRTFMAMECVEGESLKDRIEAGPMKVDDVVALALQIAAGMLEAHEKGVVHRDIKSANIMVTHKGRAKIMDFGLAKSGKGMDVTRAGTTIGTVAYMSPEQARGEPVDGRSDIWSLGVVMYEMLTGRLPFRGEYEPAVVYSILHEDPEPVSSIRTDVPEQLNSIVDKMLKKDPAQRYRNAEELIRDLKPSAGAVEARDHRAKSIVVLPFDDISPGRDNEYFSDGLAEEIISDLSKVRGLRVISRSSAVTYKGTKKTVGTIGRELDVRYVLEGSVRKAGNNLRITAQLIDATDDTHLWAEKYSGSMDDVFDIQEKVSRSIVDALKIELAPEESRKLGARPIDNVQAYECYLRARHEMYCWTQEGLTRALQHFQNGLDLIGDNALLYVGMGTAYWWYFNIAVRPDPLHLKKAEEYARKAFEVEPDSAHGHRLMGFVAAFRSGLREALFHLKKAYAADPDDPDTLLFLAVIYGECGIESAGRAFVDRVIELDPLTPMNYMPHVLLHLLDGRFGAALDVAKKAYRMGREIPYLRMNYAFALAYNNRVQEACDVIDRLVKDTPDVYPAQLMLFFKLALQGDRDKALASLSPELTTKAEYDFEVAWQLAECFALIGETDNALYWLEHSIDRGVVNYPFFSKHDIFLENIRGDERFKKLMMRVKNEWESFEA
jgi:serine/threonine protein kinase